MLRRAARSRRVPRQRREHTRRCDAHNAECSGRCLKISQLMRHELPGSSCLRGWASISVAASASRFVWCARHGACGRESPACGFALSRALLNARAPSACWARARKLKLTCSPSWCARGAPAAPARLASHLPWLPVSLFRLARAPGRAASPRRAPLRHACALGGARRVGARPPTAIFQQAQPQPLHLACLYRRVSGSLRRF